MRPSCATIYVIVDRQSSSAACLDANFSLTSRSQDSRDGSSDKLGLGASFKFQHVTTGQRQDNQEWIRTNYGWSQSWRPMKHPLGPGFIEAGVHQGCLASGKNRTNMGAEEEP